MEFSEAIIEQQDGQQVLSADDISILAMAQYFNVLRKERGNNPEASPLDLEILIVFKYMMVAVSDPIESLRKIGLIAFGNHICINCNLFCDFISSCRSRVNNTLKRLGWNVLSLPNPKKYHILQPLVSRVDSRNWTIRIIPSDAELFKFINSTTSVQFLMACDKLLEIMPKNEDAIQITE